MESQNQSCYILTIKMFTKVRENNCNRLSLLMVWFQVLGVALFAVYVHGQGHASSYISYSQGGHGLSLGGLGSGYASVLINSNQEDHHHEEHYVSFNGCS